MVDLFDVIIENLIYFNWYHVQNLSFEHVYTLIIMVITLAFLLYYDASTVVLKDNGVN